MLGTVLFLLAILILSACVIAPMLSEDYQDAKLANAKHGNLGEGIIYKK